MLKGKSAAVTRRSPPPASQVEGNDVAQNQFQVAALKWKRDIKNSRIPLFSVSAHDSRSYFTFLWRFPPCSSDIT